MSTVEWAAEYPNWPASAFPLQLGNHVYTKAQSFAILTYPGDAGDDLSRLCREMVAAELNIANGSGHECADGFIDDANVLIGNLVPRPVGNDTHVPTPESTNLIFHITQYNKGQECCARHCNINAPEVEPRPCVNNIEINVPSLIGYTHDQALDKWHETGFTGPMIFDRYGEPLHVAAQSINAGTPTCPTDPIGITMR